MITQRDYTRVCLSWTINVPTWALLFLGMVRDGGKGRER